MEEINVELLENTAPLKQEKEYLHLCHYRNGQLYVHWNIHSWRYHFVYLYNQTKSSLLTIRVIGWQENSQNSRGNAKFTDIIVKKEVQDQFVSYLPHFDVSVVEIGLGEGENFFPLMQSNKLSLHHVREFVVGFDEQIQWNSWQLDEQKWFTQFSTYTYYEQLGGEECE